MALHVDYAIGNAQSWFENIREMVEASCLHLDSAEVNEDARERIEESALSVRVRSGWYSPGSRENGPAEYEILLTTGGPALRIIGELSEHGEPESATLQWQDCGTPWTDIHMAELLMLQPSEITPSKADEILLAFASVFYFGE